MSAPAAIVPTRPALVPLTFEIGLLERLKPLAGVAVDVRVKCGKATFDEAMLFTHRGISGPAILQISSYWREGDELLIDMAPRVNIYEELRAVKSTRGRGSPQTVLNHHIPQRLAQLVAGPAAGNLADCPDKLLRTVLALVLVAVGTKMMGLWG